MPILHPKDNGFGGIDEQALTDEFEEFVGGPRRGFRLKDIYTRAQQSTSGNRYTLKKMPTTNEVFLRMAKNDGYTERQAKAFLELP